MVLSPTLRESAKPTKRGAVSVWGHQPLRRKRWNVPMPRIRTRPTALPRGGRSERTASEEGEDEESSDVRRSLTRETSTHTPAYRIPRPPPPQGEGAGAG